MPSEVLGYAYEVGNSDVTATLDWLEGAGFALAESLGGRDEGFGNIYLLFGGHGQVRIVRDRSQWDIAVGFEAGTRLYGLAVLTAARDRSTWQYPSLDPGALPTQLPPGLVWRDELPSVIQWLHEPGSAEEAERVDAEARRVMRERLGS